MAGNIQWTTDFADPPTIVVTNTLSGYQKEWTKDRTLPFRGWRSADVAGNRSITFDNGTATNLAGIAVFSVNASVIRMQMSDDAVNFTGLPGYAATQDFVPARFGGVYCHFLSFATQSKRAIWVSGMSGFPLRTKQDAGYYESAPTYFEFGAIFWIKSLTTMAVSVKEPLVIEHDTGESEEQMPSGRVELLRVGFPINSFSLEAKGLNPTQLAEWRNVIAGGKDRPVLWYLNSDRPEEMLWAQITGTPQETEEQNLTTITSRWRTVA